MNSSKKENIENIAKIIRNLTTKLIDYCSKYDDEETLIEVRNYLAKKTVAEKKSVEKIDNTITTLMNVRNSFIHGKPYNKKLRPTIEKIIWIILPDLEYFKTTLELYNFLSYVFNKDYPPVTRMKYKSNVIKPFREYYSKLKEPEKSSIFEELALRTFNIISKDDLVRLSNKLQ